MAPSLIVFGLQCGLQGNDFNPCPFRHHIHRLLAVFHTFQLITSLVLVIKHHLQVLCCIVRLCIQVIIATKSVLHNLYTHEVFFVTELFVDDHFILVILVFFSSFLSSVLSCSA